MSVIFESEPTADAEIDLAAFEASSSGSVHASNTSSQDARNWRSNVMVSFSRSTAALLAFEPLVLVAGAWVATPAYDALTAQGCEHAYKELFVRTITSFEGLLRPLEVKLSSHFEDPAPYAVKVNYEGRPWPEVRREVLNAIEAFRGDIYLLEWDVEVCAYARTAEQPDLPVRGWMRLGDYLTIRAGKEEPEGVVTLSVGHTLFHPGEGRGTINRVLYELNQPLLEAALRRWEQQVGPISETDGLWPIYPYGYELLYEPVED